MNRHSDRFVVAVGALVCGFCLVSAPVVAATLRVLPGNLQGWAITTTAAPPAALGALVVGPATPPAGTGSAELRVGPDGDQAAQFRHAGYAGTRLADLDVLKYSTHVTAWVGGQAPYIILNIDFDLNGTVDDLLFFEPEYQNGYTANVPTQADLVLGVWQEWDALQGGWWSSGGHASAGPGADVKTIAQYVAALPNATIVNSATGGGVRIVAGFGAGAWDNFIGNADLFGISTTTTSTTEYDFEVNGFDLRVPQVLGPDEPIMVFLDVSSGRSEVASVGARLTYDPSGVTLVSAAVGSGVPGSWNFAYLQTSVAGEVDAVITDTTAAAATVSGPFTAREALKLTFSRIGVNCTASSFGFNPAPPSGSAAVNAFPTNHYIHYLDSGSSSVLLDPLSGSSVSGPSVDDHGFIRGNVNNRSAHVLDLGDVNDLANSLFGSLPMVPCAAAYDTNNDGLANITDLVTLVQGIFNSAEITIRPPNFANPGLGIPGVVVPDGGTIPSILACAEGETCP